MSEEEEAIERINKVREKQFNQFAQTGKTNITIGVNDLRAIETVLSYIEKLEELPNKIRDKIEELEENRDKYFAEGKLGGYIEADIKIEILKSIIGE